MDQTDTGYILFKGLVYFLDNILKGDTVAKVTLLYRLHIPPAFVLADLEESPSMDSLTDKPEMAAEASEVLGTPTRVKRSSSSQVTLEEQPSTSNSQPLSRQSSTVFKQVPSSNSLFLDEPSTSKLLSYASADSISDLSSVKSKYNFTPRLFPGSPLSDCSIPDIPSETSGK